LTWYQEWFGEEYLDLYSYRDDEEAKRHVGFVRSQFGPIEDTVLDLACGSGRHIQELRRKGYAAVGCDLSMTLLWTATRQHSCAGTVVRADMRRLPFHDESFGGLVNFFTSFGYFENEDDNLSSAREMARVLRTGAPLLVDYLNVHRELERLVQTERRDLDGDEALIERWFDPASKTFNKRITIGSKRFLERVRGYERNELAALFDTAGFRVDHTFGDFDGREYYIGSPRLILTGARR